MKPDLNTLETPTYTTEEFNDTYMSVKGNERICVYIHTETFWKFLSYANIFKVFLYDTWSLEKLVCTSTLSQYKYNALKYGDCTNTNRDISNRDIKRWKDLSRPVDLEMTQDYCLHHVFSCLSKSS